MSLVTRCPHCSTLFRIVPDQIRVAGGWVRCGRCGEVFDASTRMMPHPQAAAHGAQPSSVDPATDAQGTSAASTPPAPPAEIPVQAAPPAAESLDAELAWARRLLKSPEATTLAPLQPISQWPTPAAGVAQAARGWAPAEPADGGAGEPSPAGGAAVSEKDDPVLSFSPEARDASEALPTDSAQEADSLFPSVPHAPGDEPPSFVTAARRRAFWSSAPVRALSWLVVLALIAALAGQLALEQRAWLAARFPQFAPALQAACARLGCRIEAWRNPDAITIEDSAFNNIAGNRFQLNVSLRNKADLPVASPAIELSLTDALGRTLARRVITASESGATPTIAGRGESMLTRVVVVSDPVDPAAVASYHLLAFYP